MRLVWLCAVLMCCLYGAEATYAQRDVFGNDVSGGEEKVFEGAAILGANITQVDGDTYAGFHKIGFNTGGMVYIHFNRKWGISMEMLYVQKGSRGGDLKDSYTVGTYIDKYYLNLNYVEVPLLLHMRLGPIDYEAGASYARLISSKEWAYADIPTYFDPVLCRFNTDDYNMIAGATARLSKHWFGGVRFQYSIVQIRPWDRILPRYSNGGYTGQYNDVVCFRMGYFF